MFIDLGKQQIASCLHHEDHLGHRTFCLLRNTGIGTEHWRMNWPEDLQDISLMKNNPLKWHFPLKRTASSEHNVISPEGQRVAFPATLRHSSFLSIVVNREKPFPCFPRHALPLFLLLPQGSSHWLGSQGSMILVSQVSNALTFLSRECWQNPDGLFTC